MANYAPGVMFTSHWYVVDALLDVFKMLYVIELAFIHG